MPRFFMRFGGASGFCGSLKFVIMNVSSNIVILVCNQLILPSPTSTCLNIFQFHRLEIRQYFGVYHMLLSCVCSRFETSLTVFHILHAKVFKGYVTVDATSVQKISFPLLSFSLCLEAFLFLLFLCTVPINIIEFTEPASSIIIFEYRQVYSSFLMAQKNPTQIAPSLILNASDDIATLRP